MFKVDEIINGLVNMQDDFSVKDVMRIFNTSSTTSYEAINKLKRRKKVFEVVRQKGVNNGYLYNIKERPLEYRYVYPDSIKNQVRDYMLWIESDFTAPELTNLFNVSSRTIHDVKERLIKEGELFNVGHATKVGRKVKVYSNRYREYEGNMNDKIKLEKPRTYHPVDPLAGMAVPHE